MLSRSPGPTRHSNEVCRVIGAGPTSDSVRVQSKSREILFVVAVFCASRIALEGVGLLAFYAIRPSLASGHAWNYSHLPWLSIWGVWDTGWYLEVAEHGYDLARRTGSTVANQANWAFFPAYPMLCRALADLVGAKIFPVMVLVSNASFLSALFITRHFTELTFGKSAARYVVVLLCFMPGSYVFSSAYPEAMFLLLMASVMMLVERRSWLLAGSTAALASLTRNLGIGLSLYMLVAYFHFIVTLPVTRNDFRFGLLNRIITGRFVIALMLPGAAISGFCLYLFIHVGDPIAFVTVQDGWLRHFEFPLVPLLMPWDESGFWHNPLNYTTALLAIVLLVQLGIWRRWALFALGAFLLFMPLTSGLESYVRYSICMLPLIMAAGRVLASEKMLAIAALPLIALLNGMMMVGWALGMSWTF